MTEQPDRAIVARACRTLLHPIAALLLKCGMSWREFAEISRLVFVAEATAGFGLRGRPTNVSRVSILTGLSRREVTRLRATLLEPEPPLPNKTTDATRVLSGWHQDPEFLDAAGQPAVLPADGPCPSFASLAQRYGGDVPATSLRKELQRVGALSVMPDGRLEVRRRYYMPASFSSQWLLNAGSMLRDLGNSIVANMGQSVAVKAGSPEPSGQFVGRAVNESIPVSALPEFKAFMETQGQHFLEQVDAWLSEHEKTHRATAQPVTNAAAEKTATTTLRLGVGMFLIADESTDIH